MQRFPPTWIQLLLVSICMVLLKSSLSVKSFLAAADYTTVNSSSTNARSRRLNAERADKV